MPKPIIAIENLSKRYRIGGQREPYLSLREEVMKYLSRKAWRGRNKIEEFWALKNLSFSVEEGAALGIIGRNGAGKTTLLKILSQITPPTQGKIKMRGRVSSLLEVGTGFHPELTGRENIFLNGTILGMSHREVARKFDEIVAFAEVEKFLDTPVKRFSSGMYVRLAFAVAAHLEPEILIVDEVLAVGDAQFQKKCLGKMGEVTKGGRTVLFVSHNMSAVKSLCDRAVVLNAGELFSDSGAEQAIQYYLKQTYSTINNVPLEERRDRTGSGRVRFTGIRILNESGEEIHTIQSGRNYRFEIDYLNGCEDDLSNIACSIDIHDELNARVMMFRTSFYNITLKLKRGRGKFSCKVDDLPLANGLYRAALYFSHAEREVLDYIQDAFLFHVDGGDFFGTGSQGLPTHCKILTRAIWSNIADISPTTYRLITNEAHNDLNPGASKNNLTGLLANEPCYSKRRRI
jgi:lipopolysaccharide transport system ATP-binding protein